MMRNFGKVFVELLRESTLIQGGIALVTVCTIAYLFITGRPIPTTLVDIMFVILGFYFGSKSQARMMKGKD